MTGPTPLADLLPSVDALLQRPALQVAAAARGRAPVLAAVRGAVADLREILLTAHAARPADREATASRVESAALERLAARARPVPRRVYNLTGTVLHTNLGRAPLADEALSALAAAAGACDLEYDLERGARGERDAPVAALLRELTGAEDALAVNNNAAGVLLALASLAARREVIVSRGELIEIGGAFRLPEVVARAGCRLVEVGTTNRTHLADFEAAIGPRTAALMKVHPSNYAITGFTASVPETGLAALAHRHQLPFIVDLGSGSLVDLRPYGLPLEPTPRQVLAQGADLVTFSGDKLLGGPQAGLVVGRKDLIAKLRRNPLKRALRLDKLILAALTATLRLYEDPERLAQRLPGLRLLARAEADIRALGERLLPGVQAALGAQAEVALVACLSQIGSGSLPVDRLRSWSLSIRASGPKRGTATRLDAMVRAFRALPIPVIGRLQDGALLFDLRCLEDEAAFTAQLGGLAASTPQ